MMLTAASQPLVFPAGADLPSNLFRRGAKGVVVWKFALIASLQPSLAGSEARLTSEEVFAITTHRP
jgi:hypothetical protein